VEKFVACDFGHTDEQKRNNQLCARSKIKKAAREEETSTDHLDLFNAIRVSMPNLKFSKETISLRMPVSLLGHIKQEANRKDVRYQSLIKMSLAEKFS
jgi:predicted DNA binding CopG/RHH family protein